MSQVVTLPKIIASIITLALILLFSLPVLAQDATTGANRKEKVREKVEIRKEVMASREAALKARLEKFRDKKKAEITDRVNTNLNRINQKQTEQILKFLDNAGRILNKLEKRVNESSPDIKDPASAKAAIASAKETIATATASVKAQAEKDYTITVSSESTVRKDAQKMREQLHTDLKAVRVQVVDAKQAVVNAIRVAKSGKVERPGKEGTPSGRE